MIKLISRLVLKMQRPEKYLGEIETWDKAEASLKEALEEFGRPWLVSYYCF